MNAIKKRIAEQLAAGADPHRLALSLACGATLGAFPLIGFTTLLCLGAGWWLRLNQPLLQTVNYFMGPLQLALIPVFGYAALKLGRPLNVDPHPAAIASAFARDPREFLAAYGELGARAVLVWAVTAPPAGWCIYRAALRTLQRGGRA